MERMFQKGDVVLTPGGIVGQVKRSEILNGGNSYVVSVRPCVNPLRHLWLFFLREKLIFEDEAVNDLELLMPADEVRPGLKAPLYSLLVAPDDPDRKITRDDIASGKITCTIRPGHRRGYEPGASVMLSCHLKQWAVLADIRERRYGCIADVLDYELFSAGYKTRGDLEERLRKQTGTSIWIFMAERQSP